MTREIYRVLYTNTGTPVGIHEIRSLLGPSVGVQQHLDRRLRSLDPYFEIKRGRVGRETTYSLVSRRAKPLEAQGGISKTLRALILRDQRCAQCGRTPSEDGVKLHFDHKIPQRWGGTNDPDNLQPLCSECNEGKKDYYASFDKEATPILRAFTYDEPHVRIGEALKAAYPKKLRGDLLERVASAKQYQEDWQKRLRELRLLGWEIKASRQNEQGRAVGLLRATHAAPALAEGRGACCNPRHRENARLLSQGGTDPVGRRRCVFVLPDPHHPPPSSDQPRLVFAIALDVARNLRTPVAAVLGWWLRMRGASMPETAVNEHGNALSGKYHVRPRRAPFDRNGMVDPKPQSAAMQFRSQRCLRLGIPAANTTHVGATSRRTGTSWNLYRHGLILPAVRPLAQVCSLGRKD